MKNKRNLKQDDGYFDDCPVCQAMKGAGIKMNKASDDVFISELHPKQAMILMNAMEDAEMGVFPLEQDLFDYYLDDDTEPL
jgi:hypothetical protein